MTVNEFVFMWIVVGVVIWLLISGGIWIARQINRERVPKTFIRR